MNKKTIMICSLLLVGNLVNAARKVTTPISVSQPSQLAQLAPVEQPKVEEIREVLSSPKTVEELNVTLTKPATTEKESKLKQAWAWIKANPIKASVIAGAVVGGTAGIVYGGKKGYEKWGKGSKGLTQEELNKLATVSTDTLRDILPETYKYKTPDEQRAANVDILKFVADQEEQRKKLGITKDTAQSMKENLAVVLKKEGVALGREDAAIVEAAEKKFDDIVKKTSQSTKDSAWEYIDSNYPNIPEEAREKLLPIILETEFEKSKKTK